MKLYVGNLSFSTGESQLRDLFTPHGTVTDVHLVTDRMSGQSRGFAFVTMGNRHEGRPKTENHQDRSFSRRR
jgi:RNA recognition motif-containing protein